MNTAEREDQLETVLQEGFPSADRIQIIENFINEMHQSLCSKVVDLAIKYQENRKESKKFLIVKTPKIWHSTSLLDDMEFFTTETFMYDTMLPHMNSHLDVSLTPYCYKTINSKIMILENLVVSNYKRLDNNRLHLNQCLPIIEALAHFHAASYKVGQKDPTLFSKKFFHISPVLEFRQRTATFWEPILVELLRRNNESALIPKFKNIVDYLKREDDDVASKIKFSTFKFHILNHGDYRQENILLKYDSNGAIDGIKIVDFQTCFYGPLLYMTSRTSSFNQLGLMCWKITSTHYWSGTSSV